MQKRKKHVISLVLIVVLAGLFLLPTQGLAQVISSGLSGEEVASSSSISLSQSSSSSSTTYTSSISESSTSVPSSVSEPIGSEPSISSSPEASSQAIPDAEATIHIPDGQTLVLGADGFFIFRSDGGVYEDIGGEEWDTPAGRYDYRTNIVLDGATGNLRSVVHAQVNSVTGTEAELIIVGTSDISVFSSADIGINIGGIKISEEPFDLPTKVSVSAGRMGIQFRREFFIGRHVDMQVTASKNAIFLLSNPEEWAPTTMYINQGSNINLIATGVDGIAISAESLYLFAATITASAPAGIGGILLSYQCTVYMQDGIKASVDASSATGRAISCESIDVSGGAVKGVTLGGQAGVHAERYLSVSMGESADGLGEVYGEAYSGYGIVANNINENAEYPSGSISMHNGILEGHVQEGMGISSNTMSVHSDVEQSYNTRVVGTAQRGIGISVCMISAGGTVRIEGISYGASANHYQVYGSIADSVGINTLSSFTASGDAVVIGKAPKEVAGSFGIHCLLIQEGGYASGYFNAGSKVKVTAVGETAIYSMHVSLGEACTVVADGGLDGINATMFYSYGYNDGNNDMRPQITTTGQRGAGIKVSPSFKDSMSDVSISSSDIVATGGEYGFFGMVENFSTFQDSSLVAKTTGANAVAGMFLQKVKREESTVLELRIENSHIDVSSMAYGLLFTDIQVFVTAKDYKLSLPGYIKGEGAESGIKLRFSDEYLADYLSGEKKALHASEMTMPDGSRYSIWGVSTVVSPDRMGRKAAVSMPSCEIVGNGLLREEYYMLAQEPLQQERSHNIYAKDMNIVNYTNYSWVSSTDNIIHVEPQGAIATGIGAFASKIEVERINGTDDGSNLVLTDGTHQVLIITDINIAEVYFYGEGGVPEKEVLRVPMGMPIGSAPIVQKLGSDFVHWFNSDLGIVWSIENSVVDTYYVELHAVWNALEYPLLFIANAGGATVENMPAAASLFMGDLLPKPDTVPTREGSQFKHWSTTPEGDVLWDFENDTMPAGQMVLYATWESEGYTVTYDSLGGTPATQAEKLSFNTPIPGNIEIPTRLNFVFTGWYEDVEATIPWQPGAPMPAKNFTVYAGWSHEFINIIFRTGGVDTQNMPEPFKAGIGKEINFAEYQSGGTKTPTREGHVFIGWLDEAGAILPEILFAPTHDVELIAQWEQIVLQDSPEDIVVYLGTKTKAEIEEGIEYSFTYLDLLHRKHTLRAKPQWDDSVLYRSGVTKISLVFEQEGSKATLLKDAFAIYVLNHPQIISQHSQTFAFGKEISFAGFEWDAVCYTQRPDFENEKIIRNELPLTFHLNGTNTRVAGGYSPSFTAVYMDYFGEVKNLEHIVEAVVLPADKGQVFDYWWVVASQMQNKESAKQIFVTELNYSFGGDPILLAPDVFAKRILARPGQFTMMAADALTALKNTPNAQLQVDMGWLQWYFDTQDFSEGKEHYGTYPLDVSASTDQKKLEEFAADYNAMVLQFAMNKSWNGNPTMQIKVNKELAQSAKQGNTLYVFWYNEDLQRLELVGDMSNDGGDKFSIRMKSVNQDYIILDTLPLDENGKPNFVISDKTNPLLDELWQKIEELNKGNTNEIVVNEPQITNEKEEETKMLNMLFPSRLCIIIIIILLIIIAVLLFLYLRARKKWKGLVSEDTNEYHREDYLDADENEKNYEEADYFKEENRQESSIREKLKGPEKDITDKLDPEQ